MTTTLEKVSQALKKLLPPGRLWRDVSEKNSDVFDAMAGEFTRVIDRGDSLLVEFDPLTSNELLTDWETLLGLPDECRGLNPLVSDRQIDARHKLSDQGGASADFFENLAAELGFPNTVVIDILPFNVGRSTVGQKLTNYKSFAFVVGGNYPTTTNFTVGKPLVEYGWQFYFEVNLLATQVTHFQVGINTVGQKLVLFSNPVLECTIKKLKHAHTSVWFTFRAP
jgi:uncharacterized protein YmfQ (DUF2313 family)